MPSTPVDRQLLEDGIKTYTPVTVEEMQQANQVIVRLVQAESFPSEINTLSRPNQSVNMSSSLYMVDRILDENKILRVGGRIKRAAVPEDIKHPILLPRHGHTSSIVIDHYHVGSGHSGVV